MEEWEGLYVVVSNDSGAIARHGKVKVTDTRHKRHVEYSPPATVYENETFHEERRERPASLPSTRSFRMGWQIT